MDNTAVYRFLQETHPDFLHKLRHAGMSTTTTMTGGGGGGGDDPTTTTTATTTDDATTAVCCCCYQFMADSETQNYVFQHTVTPCFVAAVDDNYNNDDATKWQPTTNKKGGKNVIMFGGGDDNNNNNNNEPMPEHVLQDVAAFLQQHKKVVKNNNWKPGDILAVHHSLVSILLSSSLCKEDQADDSNNINSSSSSNVPIVSSLWGPPVDEIRYYQPPNGVAMGKCPSSFFAPLYPADPLIFGFWKVAKDKCAEICYQAIRAGYRRLDCACDYGNEVEVGQGIARALQERLCQRSDLFVTSKLWNTYHQPEHVSLALQKTFNDLGLDYVDEYLIHFPISMEFVPIEKKYPPEWTNLDGKMVVVPNDIGQTWKAMEALVDQGLCKTIGVCNFSTQLLRHLLSVCRIRPTTLQIELHPHNSQERLVRVAREAGMKVTAFSVFGASSYLELDMATEQDVLMKDPVVLDIAKAHAKTPAQILLRWALQRNTMPLCKTSTPARMQENRNVFDFYLTGRQMAALNALNKNRRYNDPGAFCEPGMGTFFPIYD